MAGGAVEKGAISEAAFFHAAAERGFMVFVPLCGATKADCIIRKPGGTPIMVQVKTATWVPKTHRYAIRGGRQQHKDGKHTSIAYEERDFDVLACYFADLNQWVIIKFEDLKGRQTMNYYPGRDNNEFTLGDWSAVYEPLPG